MLIIDDLAAKEFFERKIEDIVERRRNPDVVKTGATETKRMLLAYLHQQGEVRTVNIWMRGFRLDELSELKRRIEEVIAAAGGIGVAEIHLQDREINSPHIQYVGTNAEAVEAALAQLVVDMGYENDLASAMSKNAIPVWMEMSGAYVFDLDEQKRELEQYEAAREKRKKIEEEIGDILKDIRSLKDQFVDEIKRLQERHVSRLERRREKSPRQVKKEVRNKDLNTAVDDYFRRRRKKRRR
ncbi:MAG: hypothetical protein GXO16_05865 [Epsilonproteobacteria bacterium]|nr:hypothetical protein [Campylobacterota bacterium]